MIRQVIVVDNITKYYGKVRALDSISFKVGRGEVFGYLGPNGAGKTTTIRILMGFIKPSSGNAYVLGVNTLDGEYYKVKSRIGYVPDEFEFYRGLKGSDMIEYICRAKGCDKNILKELLDIFSLDLKKNVESYSRGMKQMLAIITAFLSNPELVVMDEPTTGLDPLMRRRLLDYIRRKAREGVSIFFSSHVLSEVQMVADRVAVLKTGRIVALEDLESLLIKSGKVVKARVKGVVKPEDFNIPGVRLVEAENSNIELLVSAKASMGEVVRVLSRYDIVDLEVREVTLEEVFQYFYER